jgi:hypothetical protein
MSRNKPQYHHDEKVILEMKAISSFVLYLEEKMVKEAIAPIMSA